MFLQAMLLALGCLFSSKVFNISGPTAFQFETISGNRSVVEQYIIGDFKVNQITKYSPILKIANDYQVVGQPSTPTCKIMTSDNMSTIYQETYNQKQMKWSYVHLIDNKVVDSGSYSSTSNNSNALNNSNVNVILSNASLPLETSVLLISYLNLFYTFDSVYFSKTSTCNLISPPSIKTSCLLNCAVKTPNQMNKSLLLTLYNPILTVNQPTGQLIKSTILNSDQIYQVNINQIPENVTVSNKTLGLSSAGIISFAEISTGTTEVVKVTFLLDSSVSCIVDLSVVEKVTNQSTNYYRQQNIIQSKTSYSIEITILNVTTDSQTLNASLFSLNGSQFLTSSINLKQTTKVIPSDLNPGITVIDGAVSVQSAGLSTVALIFIILAAVLICICFILALWRCRKAQPEKVQEVKPNQMDNPEQVIYAGSSKQFVQGTADTHESNEIESSNKKQTKEEGKISETEKSQQILAQNLKIEDQIVGEYNPVNLNIRFRDFISSERCENL